MPDSMVQRALVLLPFDPAGFEMLDRVIKPAAAAAGLQAIHLDRSVWHQNLQHSLERAVRDCTLAVAYLPDRNPNVIFELGVVTALGRSVVVMAEDCCDIPDFLASREFLIGPFARETLTRALAKTVRTAPQEKLTCTT
ncbi:MAG: hypothetical protein V3R90_05820 [Limibaculum sp.]